MLRMAELAQITKIEVEGDKLNVTTTSGEALRSRKETGVSVLELLDQRDISTGADGVQIEVKKEGRSFFGVFISFLLLIIFGRLIFYMMRGARGASTRL